MSIDFADYRDGDTVLEAAIAYPADPGKRPAVLIAHAWAGQGAEEHKIADRVAGLGYVGVAIDVFGKDVRGDPSADNSALISPWLSNRAALKQRLLAAVAFARTLDRVDAGRVAAIGYCFGGLCVLDIARSGTDDVAGVVSLHGMLDDNALDPSGAIHTKVLVEHGWLDPFAPPEKVMAFADEMTTRGADWQLDAHGTAMHAFTNPGANKPEHGLQYDAGADRRSWQSTTAFLAEVLCAASKA